MERINKKYESILKDSLEELLRNLGNKKIPTVKNDIKGLTAEFDQKVLVRNVKGVMIPLKDRGSKLSRHKATLNRINTDLSKKGRRDLKRDMKISGIAFNHMTEINKFVKTLRKKLISFAFQSLSNYAIHPKAQQDQLVSSLVQTLQSRIRNTFEILKAAKIKPTIRSCLKGSTLGSAKKSKVLFADLPPMMLQKSPTKVIHTKQPSIHLTKLKFPGTEHKCSTDKQRLKLHKAAVAIQKCYKKWRFKIFLVRQSRRLQNESFVEIDPELAPKKSTCLII